MLILPSSATKTPTPVASIVSTADTSTSSESVVCSLGWFSYVFCELGAPPTRHGVEWTGEGVVVVHLA